MNSKALKAIANMAPKLDVLLSLHSILGSSQKVVAELAQADESMSAPVRFLTASQECLAQDESANAKILYQTGVELDNVDFKALQSAVQSVLDITKKLDDIGTRFKAAIDQQIDSQYSYEDAVTLDWFKQAWDFEYPGGPKFKDFAMNIFNVDAEGNGFAIYDVETEDGKKRKCKVILVNHEPVSLDDVKKGITATEDDADDFDQTAEAEDDVDGEDVTASWCFCPNCGGDLK